MPFDAVIGGDDVIILMMKRPSTMDDVANAVEFFASPRSSYVTGQVLHLGGV